MRTKRVAIAGGGISGLTAAYKLLKIARAKGQELTVTLFDPDEPGGVFQSFEKDGCIFEGGPDSFFTKTPEVLELCAELKIESEIIATESKNRKSLVAQNNELIPLPEGFVMIAPSRMLPFLTSPLLSREGKLRALEDLAIEPSSDLKEESVADFVERRLGKEMLNKIVQPMVGGIYVGDVQKLSAQACLPEFVEMERTSGSIISALADKQSRSSDENKETKGARYAKFFSFRKGMGFLIDSLIDAIKETEVDFHQKLSVQSIKKQDNEWALLLCDGSIKSFDAVILACPAKSVANIMKEAHPSLSSVSEQITGASSVVVNLLFEKKDIDPGKLDGFGFVVPHESGRDLLACSYLSLKYQDRCKDELVILRAFLGGVFNPDILQKSDEKITELALKELDYFLDLKNKPICTYISRWQDAMPQYTIGHQSRIDAIFKHLEDLPGVFITGNFISGVGIPKCVGLASSAALCTVNHLFE